MGIGPISAVRPVSMIRPSPQGPDLTQVVEVEHLGQSGEDDCTPADRNAQRGLEDEDEPETVTDVDPRDDADAPSGNVSFFA